MIGSNKMFRIRRITCSFCRKDEKSVAKMVAGPRVYICDECANTAARIMTDAMPPSTAADYAHGPRRETSKGKEM